MIDYMPALILALSDNATIVWVAFLALLGASIVSKNRRR